MKPRVPLLNERKQSHTHAVESHTTQDSPFDESIKALESKLDLCLG